MKAYIMAYEKVALDQNRELHVQLFLTFNAGKSVWILLEQQTESDSEHENFQDTYSVSCIRKSAPQFTKGQYPISTLPPTCEWFDTLRTKVGTVSADRGYAYEDTRKESCVQTRDHVYHDVSLRIMASFAL